MKSSIVKDKLNEFYNKNKIKTRNFKMSNCIKNI